VPVTSIPIECETGSTPGPTSVRRRGSERRWAPAEILLEVAPSREDPSGCNHAEGTPRRRVARQQERREAAERDDEQKDDEQEETHVPPSRHGRSEEGEEHGLCATATRVALSSLEQAVCHVYIFVRAFAYTPFLPFS
jgi:hypothetical protein